MKTRVNQPAYPTTLHLEDAAGDPVGEDHAPGMTKRELIAAHIATGLAANAQIHRELIAGWPEDASAHAQIVAGMAVERADALIVALNNNKPKQEML